MPTPNTRSERVSVLANVACTDHPLYRLRRLIRYADVIGCILTILWMTPYGRPEEAFLMVFLFVGSLAFVQWDLWRWKTDQLQARLTSCESSLRCEICSRNLTVHQDLTDSSALTTETSPLLLKVDGDDKNKWPSKKTLTMDAVLAILFMYTYISLFPILFDYYPWRRDGTQTFGAYASVCILAAGCLHIRCWWIELMARQRQEWEREGRTESANEPDLEDNRHVDLQGTQNSHVARTRPVVVRTSACAHHLSHGAQQSQENTFAPRETDHMSESKILTRVMNFLKRNQGKRGQTSGGAQDEANQSCEDEEGVFHDESDASTHGTLTPVKRLVDIDSESETDTHDDDNNKNNTRPYPRIPTLTPDTTDSNTSASASTIMPPTSSSSKPKSKPTLLTDANDNNDENEEGEEDQQPYNNENENENSTENAVFIIPKKKTRKPANEQDKPEKHRSKGKGKDKERKS